MWVPKKIIAKNFMSYKDFEYEFLKSDTTLIYAVNQDEPGADSNGGGKSSIVKSITVAMVDLPDKSLTKEDYIMDGEDRAELDFTLENSTHKKTLQIQRVLRRNKESVVKIFEDGVENDKLSSVAEHNKRILELIGITKEDILNYYIINQDNSNSFFESTDLIQKSTISRFANADPVDKALASVQKDIADKNTEIKDLEGEIAVIDTKINTLSEQISYERTERLKDVEEQKNKYEERITNLLEGITEQKEAIGKYNEKLEKLNKELDGLELADEDEMDRLEASLKKSKDKLSESEESVDLLRDSLREVKKILSGEIKCPKCKHKWIEGDAKADVDKLEKDKKEYETLINTVEKMSEKTEKRIEELRLKLSEYNLLSDKYEDLKQEISKINKKIGGYKQSIEDCNRDIKIYRTKVKELTGGIDNKRIASLEKEILECEELKQEVLDKIGELNKEKEELTYWNINLGIKGFKTFLVNKILQSVEGYVNLYLTKFNTNLLVKIQGFKTLKTGEVRENISVLISRDGGDTWRTFKRHSGGQRKRINVCGILTLQTLINNSSKYGGLDMLLLDEFFEGLDQKGQRSVLQILENTGITTLVISHNNNDIGAGNQLWVKYSNGVSKIMTENEKRKFRESTKSISLTSSKEKSKAEA